MLFFTDTNELKPTPLSTFLFDTKFVLFIERHLHIPKPNLENPEEEKPSPKSEIGVLATNHKTKNVNECKNKVPAEQGKQCRK